MKQRDATARLWALIREQHKEIDDQRRWSRQDSDARQRDRKEIRRLLAVNEELARERDDYAFKFRTLAHLSGIDPDRYQPGRVA